MPPSSSLPKPRCRCRGRSGTFGNVHRRQPFDHRHETAGVGVGGSRLLRSLGLSWLLSRSPLLVLPLLRSFFLPPSIPPRSPTRAWVSASRHGEIGQQTLIYNFVARGTVILAEYTAFTRNFNVVASQCLQKLSSSNNTGSAAIAMADKRLQAVEKNSDGFLQPFPELGFSWNIQPDLSFSCNIHDSPYPSGGLFASVSQMGVELGVSSKSPNVTPEAGFQVFGTPAKATEDVTDYVEEVLAKKKKSILKVRMKVRNPHLRRLLSGRIVGAVSRTCVAPMETIRTHLMVGSNGNSTTEVFQNIMKTEGWKGLFHGNFVNVIRVAPSKAIEH